MVQSFWKTFGSRVYNIKHEGICFCYKTAEAEQFHLGELEIKAHFHTNASGNFINVRPKLETTQMSFGRIINN